MRMGEDDSEITWKATLFPRTRLLPMKLEDKVMHEGKYVLRLSPAIFQEFRCRCPLCWLKLYHSSNKSFRVVVELRKIFPAREWFRRVAIVEASIDIDQSNAPSVVINIFQKPNGDRAEIGKSSDEAPPPAAPLLPAADRSRRYGFWGLWRVVSCGELEI
ncbi:MAG: hypothetical protein Q9217_004676 [Psora testacea]